MSQVAAVSGAPATTTATAVALTSSEHDDIREYERIIHFRDTVVSGKHPRIKVPVSAMVKNASTSVSISQPPLSSAPERVAPSAQPTVTNVVNSGAIAPSGHATANMLSFKANSQQPAVTVPPASSAPFIPGVSKPFGSGKPEIDPVLLQKSDGLVKAEIHIQRQRLEKGLKDQIEQRRSCMKGNLQSEQLPELDISDILAKALTLVQATAPPSTSIVPSRTANASDASDSFDENTFYSSQPDTPASRPSVSRDIMGNVQIQEPSTATRPTGNSVPSLQPQTTQPLPAPTGHPPQTDVARNIPQVQIMGATSALSSAGVTAPLQIQNQGIVSTLGADSHNLLNQGYWRGQLAPRVVNSDSRDASRSDNSGNMDSDQSADQRRLQNPPQLVPNPSFRQPEEPLIRGHNLSPFAPQPAHVSPLAVARQPHIRDSDTSALQRTHAQISALRQEDTVVISPESSPQGDRASRKRNKRRNKRKADGRAQDSNGSPNIKPEPRSPSPLAVPPFIRPQKRARQSGRPESEIIYDDLNLEYPISQSRQERYPLLPVHVETAPQGYDRVDDTYSRQVRSSVAPVARRLQSPLYEERRSDGSIIRYVHHITSPSGYADPYDAVDAHPLRATSYAVANPDLREGPTYQRETRMSVRPYGDRARSRSPIIMDTRTSAMPPPSVPPHRVVINEYGRDYIEPVHTTNVSRRSVVPSTRVGDHEVMYERAPIRATSRVPAPEIIGEDGAIYRRVSPSYAPRRVITEPEYGAGFRSYRERDYPLQSMGPPSQEFVQIRGATEHRVTEQLPRDFLPRAASVRPIGPADTMAYDRFSSTRADIPPRRYAASVHPEARREVAPHVVREYGGRQTEMDIPQRAYSVRPVDRYYEPTGEGEVTYVERPRAVPQEVIYPGNGTSRQVYQ
ncbi:hypothetical protein GGS21DRAFT_535734 [Xylaria nigripes]|nr:hypothetical protein GGS21DRAFT_535734 [Xylaria nigripes]